MKMRYGSHLLVSLIVLFAITVPIVIFMVLGYRIDLHSKKLIATGTLVIDTLPKDVNIELNGKLVDKRTPATLRYILPGEYDIRLEKPGYQPFGKHVTVHPKQVTSPHSPGMPIVLFYNAPEQINTIHDVVAFSPESKTSISVETDQLTINQNGHKAAYDLDLNYLSKPDSSWTIEDQKDQTAIIMVDDKRLFLTQATSTAIDITDAVSPAKILKALALNSKTLLLLADNHNLYRFEPIQNNATVILKNVATFTRSENSNQIIYASDDSLYSFSSSALESVLIRKLGTSNTISEITTVPTGDVYVIVGDELFRVAADSVQYLASRVQSIKWYSYSQQLLIYNHNTVWVFTPNTDDLPRLVARMNDSLSQPVLAPKIGYLFFGYKDGIKSVPLDPALQSESVDILKTPVLPKGFWVDSDGKQLTVLKQDNLLELFQMR